MIKFLPGRVRFRSRCAGANSLRVDKMMIKFCLGLILLIIPTKSFSCTKIVPAGDPPYTAESYPLPLSLRRNLVYLVKSEMKRKGEYKAEVNLTGVYYKPFKEAVARAQKRRGEAATGCLTWSIVKAYDPLRRDPPLK